MSTSSGWNIRAKARKWPYYFGPTSSLPYGMPGLDHVIDRYVDLKNNDL